MKSLGSIGNLPSKKMGKHDKQVRKSLSLSEQYPCLKDITYKIINIGAMTLDSENREEEIVDFLQELIRLFRKNIMKKYKNSKKANKRTKLANYLQDMLSKIKLLSSILLEKETKKGLSSLYFGPLFKMFVELNVGSSLSSKYGRDHLVQYILNIGKNLFHDDIETLLDVFITVDIPESVQNLLLLTVFSENCYFSSTCASFYNYLVIAKILMERFSSDLSTINGIKQALTCSKRFIPVSFENYLHSTTSISNLHYMTDLIQIVNKIDSARAREGSLQRFFIEVDEIEFNLDPFVGNNTTSQRAYFVDTNPFTYLLHDQEEKEEVMEATSKLSENKSYDNVEVAVDVEMDSKELDSSAISSDQEGGHKNETGDMEEEKENNDGKECFENSGNSKPATGHSHSSTGPGLGEKIENASNSSDSEELEILGETTSEPVNDYDDEESIKSPEPLHMPNYANNTSEDENESEPE